MFGIEVLKILVNTRTEVLELKTNDLIHANLCVKLGITHGTFETVFRIVMLVGCQQAVVVHARN